MQSGFDYQIAIIGGGPAGATLGRLLPKGLSAILIDKKRAKGGFEKPLQAVCWRRMPRRLSPNTK